MRLLQNTTLKDFSRNSFYVSAGREAAREMEARRPHEEGPGHRRPPIFTPPSRCNIKQRRLRGHRRLLDGIGADFMHESAANIFAEFAALTAGRLRDLSARQLILLAAS